MVFVDGYNFIHADEELSEALEAEGAAAARAALAGRLARYAEAARKKITIVFDAARAQTPTPRTASRGNIRILFSSPGESADERILRAISRAKGGGGGGGVLVAVSDDRALRRGAKALGARVTGCGEFAAEIKKRLAARTRRAPEKPGRPSPGEVEYWMRVFGLKDEEGDGS